MRLLLRLPRAVRLVALVRLLTAFARYMTLPYLVLVLHPEPPHG